MKNLILVFFVLAVVAIHNSGVTESTPRQPSGTRADKESVDGFAQWKTKDSGYKFVYTYKGQTLTIEKTGSSDEAFGKAAKECFKHFNPTFISEDVGLDVIDVCANPRVK